MSVDLKPSACKQLSQLLAQEKTNPEEHLYFRISIIGGGCSGFQYDFEFCEEKMEDDAEYGFHHPEHTNPVPLLIDPISLCYLNGASLEYKKDLHGERFVLINPHVKKTCGCGNSFEMPEQPT